MARELYDYGAPTHLHDQLQLGIINISNLVMDARCLSVWLNDSEIAARFSVDYRFVFPGQIHWLTNNINCYL